MSQNRRVNSRWVPAASLLFLAGLCRAADAPPVAIAEPAAGATVSGQVRVRYTAPAGAPSSSITPAAVTPDFRVFGWAWAELPADLQTYIMANKCPASDTSPDWKLEKFRYGCLQPTVFLGYRAKGVRKNTTVFRWRRNPADTVTLGLHFMMDYLYRVPAALELSPSNGALQLMIKDQVDFMLQPQWVIRKLGAMAMIEPSDSVDPLDGGKPEANLQLEMARYLLAVCAAYSKAYAYDPAVQEAAVTTNLQYMTAFLNAFEYDASTGVGVRSPKRANCAPAGVDPALQNDCYFYYARGERLGVDGKLYPRAALNLYGAALRDLARLNKQLTLYRNAGGFWPGAGLSTTVNGVTTFDSLNRLRDRVKSMAIAGLYHLAFAPAWSAAQPMSPPGYAAYMSYSPGPPANYWAFYDYDLSSGQALRQSHATFCHYHTHQLNTVGGFLRDLEAVGALREDPKVKLGLSYLLSYTHKGVPEAVGRPRSTAALYQFYRGEIDPAIKYGERKCKKGDDFEDIQLYPEVREYLQSKFP